MRAVPSWLGAIPEAVSQTLRAAAVAGRDAGGVPSPRDVASGPLVLLPRAAGGIYIQFARTGSGSATAGASVDGKERERELTLPDPTRFPGVASDTPFLWSGTVLQDYAEYAFALPGQPTQTVRRLRAFAFLDVAAASSGLRSPSEAWAELFPGFAVELGSLQEETGSGLFIRMFIPT